MRKIIEVPQLGDTRTRKIFLWFPTIVQKGSVSEIRWLEWASVEEEWSCGAMGNCFWAVNRFINR
jgi:hypothetical protein